MMDGFELNKIASSILIAGIISLVVGNLADILYQPEKDFKRGYSIGIESQPTDASKPIEEEKIDLKSLMKDADAELGKRDIKKCSICHTLNSGEPNRVGPNLWNILGSKKASKPGFSYSKALTQVGGNWTYQELFEFIRSPKEFLPGTKMAFIGYKKPKDAADVIAYLRTLSPSPKPLP